MDAVGPSSTPSRRTTRTRSNTGWTACPWSIPDWHFNVRPSNTEPLLRLNLEGTSQKLMEQKRDEVLGLIRGSGFGRTVIPVVGLQPTSKAEFGVGGSM